MNNSNSVMFFHRFIDEYGNTIERNKYDNPYSYDSFVTWQGGNNKEINDTVYSDRLFQWNCKKYSELCKKHFRDEKTKLGFREL